MNLTHKQHYRNDLFCVIPKEICYYFLPLSSVIKLGGGFKDLFWPMIPRGGEMIQFDGCIFFETGWFNHQLDKDFLPLMVQKSGVHQLRLVGYPIIDRVFHGFYTSKPVVGLGIFWSINRITSFGGQSPTVGPSSPDRRMRQSQASVVIDDMADFPTMLVDFSEVANGIANCSWNKMMLTKKR